MTFPFGVGVGDFITVTTLAWNLWKSCSAAPTSFGNICDEVLALHVVLKQIEENLPSLTSVEKDQLNMVTRGCANTLKDLQNLIKKYESLGTSTRRTWDRLNWGRENVTDLRVRLMSNITLLNTFWNTSQCFVASKLDKLREELQDERYDGSAITPETIDSLSSKDKQTWRDIRKELEDFGITVAAFDQNREFIIGWLKDAKGSGLLAGRYSSMMVGESIPPLLRSSVGSFRSLESRASYINRRSVRHRGSVSSLTTIRANTLTEIQEGNEKLQTQTAHNFYKHSNTTHPALRGYSTVGEAIPASQPATSEKPKVQSPPIFIPAVSEDTSSLSSQKSGVGGLWTDAPAFRAIPAFRRLQKQKTLIHEAFEVVLDAEQVRQAIRRGFDTNARNSKDQTVLDMAARHGLTETVQVLLDNGAEPTTRTKSRANTPLHTAASEGHSEVVEVLLAHGADLESRNNYNWTALDYAAYGGHIQTVQVLLKGGAIVNGKVKHDWDKLKQAAFKGHTQAVVLKTLLDLTFNCTALHNATLRGHKAIVLLLLSAGADIDARNFDLEETALHIAVTNRKDDILQILLDKGANVNAVARDGMTALHIATQQGRTDIVQLLVNKGSEVMAKNAALNGQTAIHIASSQCYVEILEVLLEAGADVKATTREGQTALHIAARQGHKEVVQLLLIKGADITATANGGKSAVHVAASRGHLSIVRQLLVHGAEIDARDDSGQTALHLAALYGHEATMQLLLAKGASVDQITIDKVKLQCRKEVAEFLNEAFQEQLAERAAAKERRITKRRPASRSEWYIKPIMHVGSSLNLGWEQPTPPDTPTQTDMGQPF